jgi:GNAT superfamily N-acetyltransferase
VIRRATAKDADVIGDVFVRARDEMAYLPRIPDEDRPRLGGWIVQRHEVWVAEDAGRISGFSGLGAAMLDHLYVDPAAQNRGLGTRLLDHAKSQRPAGFQLWVFQQNHGARRFYERHGCSLVKLTDGSLNMEKEPDALYEWTPTSPGSRAR